MQNQEVEKIRGYEFQVQGDRIICDGEDIGSVNEVLEEMAPLIEIINHLEDALL